MTKNLKRMTALALALILVAGQLAIPTAAADEAITTTEEQTLELPTVTGGETTEPVDVTVTVTTEENGDVSATMTTTSEGGQVTDSGLTVEVTGSGTADAQGNSHSEMTYSGANAEGTYKFEGGTEVTVETPDVEDLTVDIITTPPAEGEGTTPPAEGEGTTPPAEGEGTTPPAEGEGTTPPAEGEGTTPPAEGESTTPPAEGETTTPPAEPVIKSSETVTNADGSTTTKVVYEDGKTVEITTITNADGSTTTNTVVVTGEASTVTTPTNEGDNLKSEDPANFDQTTVITDPTVVKATTTTKFESSMTQFVDADGNPVHVETSDAYNYYYGEIYTVDNIEESIDPNYGWAVHPNAPHFYKVSVDENGNEVKTKLEDEKVCQRVVYDSKGTEDTSDDEIVNGLYCVDMSTGIKWGYDYRMVNLEDVVEEGYYGEEDVAHLRAIMTHGYTWNDDDDNGYTNLENIKTKIRNDLAAALDSGDAAKAALLTAINVDTLTRQEAAAATGMAVWHYGNRFDLAEGDTLVGENANSNIQGLYEYLITLKEEPVEQEIITEDKFVESMSVVIGDKVQDSSVDTNNDGISDNNDADNTNDVYNASVKFSMVVTPDKENDDLLVHIVNAQGVVQKTVRIAGPQPDDEKYEYIQPDADGNYVIGGLELQENTDNVFNINLEGTQKLAAGVYVFESQHTLTNTVEMLYDYYTSDKKWESEKASAAKKLGIRPEEMTKEIYREKIMELRFADDKYKNEDGSYNWDYICRSQNFIGKTEGTAAVSANMKVTFNFNMDEGSITTIREYRSEYDPSEQSGDNGGGNDEGSTDDVPGGGGGGGFRMRFIPAGEVEATVEIEEEPTPLAAAPAIQVRPAKTDDGMTTILDEEVPLADAPETGDATLLFGILGLVSLAGSGFLGKKKEEI